MSKVSIYVNMNKSNHDLLAGLEEDTYILTSRSIFRYSGMIS